MSGVAVEIQKALGAIDELLDLLHRILEAMDEMDLVRPAINVNDAIENLTALRVIVIEAQNSPPISPSVWKKIERVRKGLALPKHGFYG